MGWTFDPDIHVRPNVYYWSPKAYKERQEVKQRREEAQRTYLQARKKVDDEDYAGAEALLEVAIGSWPENPKYLLAMAHCIAINRGQPERALSWYDEAIAILDCPLHRASRARALATLGRLQEAKVDCDKALEGDPENGVYLQQRGIILQRMGKYFEAVQDYGKALPLLKREGHPVFDCIFNRGYCQRLLHNHDEALADMESAMQANMAHLAVKTVLGYLHAKKRRLKAALDLFNVPYYNRREVSAAANNNVGLMQYLLATAEEEQPGRSAADSGSSGSSKAPASQPPPRPGGGPGGPGRESQASSRASSATATASVTARGEMGGGPDSDVSSDEDEGMEGARVAAMVQGLALQGGQGKRVNEHPKQWLMSILYGGGSSAALIEAPERRALLDQALANFEAALRLYNDPAKRAQACRGEQDTHALRPWEAGDIMDGALIILTNDVRVPGTPVIHDKELEDGEIQYNRGLVHLALGLLQEAEVDFQEALKTNPRHAHYPHYQAVVVARLGNLSAAVEWNLSALSLNPTYFPALYHLGLIYHLQGRNAEAIQRLDSALGLMSKDWAVMEARGRVLQELDRHAEALPSLRDALLFLDPEEGDPIRARLHYAIAQSAIATHTPELLKSSLIRAQQCGQDAASVYNLRGLLALREGKLGKALRYLTYAIQLSPQEARFLFDRSQVYVERKEWRAAVADMSAALAMLPGCASLLYARGMAYFATMDDEDALKDFEACASLVAQPDHGGVLRPDPRLWESSKFMSNLSAPPVLTPSLWYHLGCARARLGQQQGAVAAFREAGRLLPRHPAVLHELAKSLQGCKCYQDAVDMFTRTLELQPHNARALFRRGLARKSLKDYEGAAEDMETAKKLDPSLASLRVDYRLLSQVDYIELVRPGQESYIGSGPDFKRSWSPM